MHRCRPPCRVLLLTALIGAAFATPVRAQSESTDAAPIATPGTVAPDADASDWGSHPAFPAPSHPEEPRDPPPARVHAEPGKRDEFDDAELTLVDDPPEADDDPPEPVRPGAATLRFAAGTATEPVPPPDRFGHSLWQSLAAVLGADLPDGGASAPRADTTATAMPSASARVLDTLADVLSDRADDAQAVAVAHATPSPSDRVLDALAHVLSDHHGAPRATAAATPSDRVLDTLARVLEHADAPRAAAAVDITLEPPPATPVDLEIDVPLAVPVDIEIEPTPRANPFGGDRVAMSDAGLDRTRGGFTTPDGLRISFGIERAVYVNGSLVTTTSLNVSELGVVSAGNAASPTPPAMGTIAVIQNGAGNTFLPVAVPAGSLGTVVQNSLDGQKIQSVSVINATVNSLGVLRSMTTQSNLRNAIVDSLRR